jgi:hypothetical protein
MRSGKKTTRTIKSAFRTHVVDYAYPGSFLGRCTVKTGLRGSVYQPSNL